jgi:hypothetical protein
MALDPLRAYSEAKQEYDRWLDEARDLSKLYHELSRALRKEPPMVMFENLSAGAGFPTEIATKKRIPHYDATRWPTAAQVAEVVVNCSDARRRALAAYDALSEAEQQSVTRPPK